MYRGEINKYIKESASSWLLTRIAPRCTVNKIYKSYRLYYFNFYTGPARQ